MKICSRHFLCSMFFCYNIDCHNLYSNYLALKTCSVLKAAKSLSINFHVSGSILVLGGLWNERVSRRDGNRKGPNNPPTVTLSQFTLSVNMPTKPSLAQQWKSWFFRGGIEVTCRTSLVGALADVQSNWPKQFNKLINQII